MLFPLRAGPNASIRRGFALVAAVALAALSSSSPIWAEQPPDLRTRVTGSDWPRFLGPGGDGRSSERGLPTDWGARRPAVIWQTAMGEGYAGPSVSRGRIFLFDLAGGQARLTCLKSETGEMLWRSGYPTDYRDYYDYSNGPRATPLVDGDHVYTFGVEGRLRCHRVADGSLVWDLDTSERFGVVQNFFGVGASPVVEEGLLIVPIGGSPPGSPGIHSGRVRPNGTGVVAFDKLTGDVRYTLADELAAYASPTLATIADRRWAFVFARGGLIAFEPATGDLDFHYPWRAPILESVNAATPVVVGDTVFISETYGPGSSLLRVRPGAFEVVWKDPPGREKSLALHWDTPVHHQGYLYASSGRHSGDAELRSVELATGRVAWSKPGLTRSTLLYADGHLLALTEYGRLLLVEATPEAYREVADLTPTDPRGRTLLRYPAWTPPVLAHGILYVRGRDRLVALELIPAD